MVKLNLQQIKKIELDILKEFVAYCDKHSLRYYLAYGSLIGAIRIMVLSHGMRILT